MRTATAMFIALAACATAAPAAAQDEDATERRVYWTKHVNPRAPVIDGRLDDPCWRQVEWATDFIQYRPDEGKAPCQQTAFKILYDDEALYVAYRAHDSEPEKIVSRLARRDWFPGDWVEVNIDSYHDHRTAYSFTASVSGVRGDEFICQDGDNWDSSWDPIWEFRSRIDDEGWTAEVRIPFSQLRYSDAPEQVWGIQVQRRVFREEERSVWQRKKTDETGWVSRFGELRGLRDLPKLRRIELMPYGLARGERFEAEPGNPYWDGERGKLGAGLDGKIGVSSNLTLDFTVNPDFGQVEADPSQVNLSAFETYFGERRPFFIEGQDILAYRIAPAITGGSFTSDRLFYSRRVGARPSWDPRWAGDYDWDNEHVDQPENTSILGAAKLTGKTAGGLSIGVLESVTAEEKAKVDLAGDEREETVEPLANYFVGRLQKDYRHGNTRVGGMLTAVNRRIDDPQLEFLHESAYAGGLDFLHQWHDRDWYLAANLLGSRVAGTEEAMLATQTSSARYYQRPDKDHTAVDSTLTSLAGHAGSARLYGRPVRFGGGAISFETGVAWRSPGFEINDAGYMTQADRVNQFTWCGYWTSRPFWIFHGFGLNTNQWIDWDFGGTPLANQWNVNTNMDFRNRWGLYAGLTRTNENLDASALRGGPALKIPGDISFNSNFWTDGSKPMQLSAGGWFCYGDEDFHRSYGLWFTTVWRPCNALRLSLSPDYTKREADVQWVGAESFGDEDRYIFSSMTQRTLSLTFRVDYSLTPNLSLQYYGSPFVSAGDYHRFKRVTSPRAEAYEDRFHEFTGDEIAWNDADGVYEVDEDGDGTADYDFSDRDFNVRYFNSNLVLRWEYQPGSIAYLVWSQSRSGYVGTGAFSARDDLDALFDVHPHNVFLIKVSKWLSI